MPLANRSWSSPSAPLRLSPEVDAATAFQRVQDLFFAGRDINALYICSDKELEVGRQRRTSWVRQASEVLASLDRDGQAEEIFADVVLDAISDADADIHSLAEAFHHEMGQRLERLRILRKMIEQQMPLGSATPAATPRAPAAAPPTAAVASPPVSASASAPAAPLAASPVPAPAAVPASGSTAAPASAPALPGDTLDWPEHRVVSSPSSPAPKASLPGRSPPPVPSPAPSASSSPPSSPPARNGAGRPVQRPMPRPMPSGSPAAAAKAGTAVSGTGAGMDLSPCEPAAGRAAASARPHARPTAAVRHPLAAPPAERLKLLVVLAGKSAAVRPALMRYAGLLGLQFVVKELDPDQPHVLLEQLHEQRDAGFAIVCLAGELDEEDLLPDATGQRTLGYAVGLLVGRLGRNRVVLLTTGAAAGGLAFIPGYQRLVSLPLDSKGNWQFQLTRRMRQLELPVDLNRLT